MLVANAKHTGLDPPTPVFLAPDRSVVAPRPPMGWSSWNSLAGGISEQLIRAQADAMVASGMRDAGYSYINVDDLWAELDRDLAGNLVADSKKFPNGMKALAGRSKGVGLSEH